MLIELRERMKIIKTGNLYLSMFIFGLSVSLTGPCLLDLQRMVETDTRHIAMIYTARSTGFVIGAIIGGILLDLLKWKQAILMGCNLSVAITMFGIPWCRNVETLMAFMSINGFSLGAIETGGNVICLGLWGKDSNPIFQGLHFAFSLGGFLSPLIAAPFLESIRDLPLNIDNSTNVTSDMVNPTFNLSNISTNLTHLSSDIPKIIYPFSIIAIVALLVTILHLAVCIISPTEDKAPKDTSKIANSERSFLFMFSMIIFAFMMFFVIAGTEIGYAQTLTLFSVKGKLHLTTTQGSYITSAFWAAFMVSRLASIYLSMKISSLKLLISDICLIAVAALILLFLMPNEWALWLASVIYGAGAASSYAALVGYINTHINISNKFSAVFNVGCATGEMIVPFLIAYFIDTFPEMLSFVIAASAILMTVLFFILHCMFRRGRKVNDSKNIACHIAESIPSKNLKTLQ